MVKSKTLFICQNCGASYPKWTGKCDNCGQWNTLVEQAPVSSGKSAVSKSASSGRVLSPQTMQSISIEETAKRMTTGYSDLDAVLGGGILPGGVMLMAGQPGIGKSTLLLQVASEVGKTQSVLYASGEESASQVKLRAERLGANTREQLHFVASTSADDIAATIRSGEYRFVIIDSIQTLSLDEITSAPGTVSQITNSSNVIIRAAKEAGAAVVLVGHVTKEGSIAGPKVLEHLVDVVLQFEVTDMVASRWCVPSRTGLAQQTRQRSLKCTNKGSGWSRTHRPHCLPNARMLTGQWSWLRLKVRDPSLWRSRLLSIQPVSGILNVQPRDLT